MTGKRGTTVLALVAIFAAFACGDQRSSGLVAPTRSAWAIADCTGDPFCGMTTDDTGGWSPDGGDGSIDNFGDLVWPASTDSGAVNVVDDGSTVSDGYLADGTCIRISASCTPLPPTHADSIVIVNEILRLRYQPDSTCVALGNQLSQKLSSNSIYFYNDYVTATNSAGVTGQLMGAAHPADNTPLARKLGVYKGARSEDEITQTLRHEAAHFAFGVDDVATDPTSSSPYNWNADKIATYCKG